jgi:site-specific DNA recombinase
MYNLNCWSVIDVRTDGVSGVMRDMMAPRKKVAAE